MKKVKTHKFRLGRYNILFCEKLYGYTDIPDETKNGNPICYRWKDTDKTMEIVEEGGLSELDTTLHEAMHAEGIPDKYIHDGGSNRLSNFLWRLGYRRHK